jgi:spore coat polysaccharide biosynthesis protein SpsF (cytidylyltransferase family)
VELKTVLITQARIGSTRLPGKVLMEINQTPLLKIHLDRLKKSKKVDKIIVATTICDDDNIIEELATDWGYEVFRGSENDVLDRFYQAVKSINPLWVVRVTSDCPLIDPELVDKIIEVPIEKYIDEVSMKLINESNSPLPSSTTCILRRGNVPFFFILNSIRNKYMI